MKKNSAQPQKSAPKRLLKHKVPVRKLLAGLLLATMLVTLIPSSLLLAGAEEIVQSSPAVTGAPAPTTSPSQPTPTPTSQPATPTGEPTPTPTGEPTPTPTGEPTAPTPTPTNEPTPPTAVQPTTPVVEDPQPLTALTGDTGYTTKIEIQGANNTWSELTKDTVIPIPLPPAKGPGFRVTYNFAIPGTVIVNGGIAMGKSYTLPVPANLGWNGEDKSFILVDKSGDREINLGTLCVNGSVSDTTTTNAVLTFDYPDVTEEARDTYIASFDETVGITVQDLSFFCSITKEAIGSVTTWGGTLAIGETTVKIQDETDKPRADVKLTKSHSNPTDKYEITWTVDIDIGGYGEFENCVFSDLLEKQTYVESSFFVNDQAKTLDTSAPEKTIQYTFSEALSTYVGTDGHIKIKFTTVPTADAFFDTKGTVSTALAAVTLKNKATLTVPITGTDSKAFKSNEDSCTINPVWISKAGERITTGGNRRAKWTVIIRSVGGALSGVTLYDRMATGLAIDMDTLKYETSTDSGVSWTEPAELKNGSPSGATVAYADVDTEDADLVVGGLALAKDGQIRITYETTITEELIYKNTQLENKAWLGFTYTDGSGGTHTGATAEVGNPVLAAAAVSKSGSYDKTTHTITWTITANPEKLALTDGHLTDKLDTNRDRLKILTDSFTEDGAKVAVGENKLIIDADEKGFTLYLEDINQKSATVTYQTQLTEKADYAYTSSKRFQNQVTLTATQNGTSVKSPLAKPDIYINLNVLKKSLATVAGYSGYNYANKTVTWEFKVNEAAIPMAETENPRIIDDLPKGFSIRSATTNGTALTVTQDKTDTTTHPNRWVIALGNHVNNKSAIVTVVTAVDIDAIGWKKNLPLASIKPDANTAYLERDGEYPSSGGECKASCNTPEIKGNTLQKGGIFQSTNGCINYKILINPLGLNLNQSADSVNRVVDTLDPGLQVDLNSLHLYKVPMKPDGTPDESLRTEVLFTETGASFTYVKTSDLDSSILTVLLPTDDKTATYQLVYTADIVVAATDGTTFKNSAVLNGGTTSQTGGVETKVTGMSGTAISNRLSIIRLKKTDSEDTNRLLKGAVFGIFDSEKRELSRATTGDDGVVTFKVKKLASTGYYTIKELTPPVGYKLDPANRWAVGVTVQPTAVGYYNWGGSIGTSSCPITNELLKNTVTFVKKNDLGYILPNVEFNLKGNAQNEKEYNRNAVSDANGVVTFTDVPVGTYVLTETTPVYHETHTETFSVSIDEKGIPSAITDNGVGESHKTHIGTENNGTVLLNTAHKGSIKLLKVDDKDATKRLSGAVFALYDGDGTGKPLQYLGKDGKPKAMVTDAKGELTFDNLMLGRVYTLREVSAPDKYDRIADQTIKLWPEADSITVNGKLEKGDIPAPKAGSDPYTLALTLRDPLTYVPTPGPGDTDLYPEATPKPSPSVSPKPSPSVSPAPSPSVSPTPTPSPTPTVPGEVPPVLPPENPPEGPTVNPPEDPTVNPPVNPPVAPPAVQPLPDGGIQGDITPGDPLYYIDDNGVPRGKGETPDPLYWIDPNGVPLGYMDPDGDWVFIDPNEIPLGFVEPDGTWVSFTPQTGDASDGWMVAFALLLVALSGMTALAARQGYRVYSKKRGQKSDRDNP